MARSRAAIATDRKDLLASSLAFPCAIDAAKTDGRDAVIAANTRGRSGEGAALALDASGGT